MILDLDKQQGVTLIELMISLALGLLLMVALMSIYINTIGANADSLNVTRLNQEGVALMNVITSEIRRAGYDGDVKDDDLYDNQFNATDSTNPTELMVYDSATTTLARPTQSGATISGDCILFGYDADDDGVLDTNEAKGFRLIGNQIQMRTGASLSDFDDCTAGQWQVISDSNRISVTTLSFSLDQSSCHNMTVKIDADLDGSVSVAEESAYVTNSNCYSTTPASSDVTIHKRNVGVSISLQDAEDPLYRSNINDSVEVRNNLYYIWP